MTGSSGTGNTAPGLTAVTILFCLWALLSYVVRVWVRLRKSDNWGLDDTAISLSALFILGNLGAVCYSIHRGFGNPWITLSESDIFSISKSLYASQILYVVSVGTTRTSASFFTARFLARDRSHERIANAFTGLCASWTIASVFAIAIRSPYLKPWESRDGSSMMFVRWLVVEALGVGIDLFAIAVAVYLVWTLHMAVGKRIAVCTIFSCRLLVIPLIVLRLIYLHPSHNPGQLGEPNLKPNLLTQAVLNTTFILASITCLKPFLRPFHSDYAISTMDPARNPSGWEKPSKSASSGRDAFYELSSASNSKRDKPIVSIRSHVEDAEWSDEQDLIQSSTHHGLVLRPDRVMERMTTITAGHPPSRGRNHRDGITVSTTSVWNISYE